MERNKSFKVSILIPTYKNIPLDETIKAVVVQCLGAYETLVLHNGVRAASLTDATNGCLINIRHVYIKELGKDKNCSVKLSCGLCYADNVKDRQKLLRLSWGLQVRVAL